MQFVDKTVHAVMRSELERAVSEFHGAPYSLDAPGGRSLSEIILVQADASALEEFEADGLRQWQESGMEGHSPRLSTVLTSMVRAEAIPPGWYLVDTAW